jgi:hypothetical protein
MGRVANGFNRAVSFHRSTKIAHPQAARRHDLEPHVALSTKLIVFVRGLFIDARRWNIRCLPFAAFAAFGAPSHHSLKDCP